MDDSSSLTPSVRGQRGGNLPPQRELLNGQNPLGGIGVGQAGGSFFLGGRSHSTMSDTISYSSTNHTPISARGRVGPGPRSNMLIPGGRCSGAMTNCGGGGLLGPINTPTQSLRGVASFVGRRISPRNTAGSTAIHNGRLQTRNSQVLMNMRRGSIGAGTPRVGAAGANAPGGGVGGRPRLGSLVSTASAFFAHIGDEDEEDTPKFAACGFTFGLPQAQHVASPSSSPLPPPSPGGSGKGTTREDRQGSTETTDPTNAVGGEGYGGGAMMIPHHQEKGGRGTFFSDASLPSTTTTTPSVHCSSGATATTGVSSCISSTTSGPKHRSDSPGSRGGGNSSFFNNMGPPPPLGLSGGGLEAAWTGGFFGGPSVSTAASEAANVVVAAKAEGAAAAAEGAAAAAERNGTPGNNPGHAAM